MCLIQHFYKTTTSLVFSKGIFNAWGKKSRGKKKLPFSIFAKKKRNGALPVKTSCITTSMLCTLLQKSQSGHKPKYPHDQNLCEIELPISVFLARNLFFAENVPLHFGIDFEQDRIIWWHSILFRKCYISACYIYQKQSCVFLSRKSDNTSRSNIIRKLHTNKTF